MTTFSGIADVTASTKQRTVSGLILPYDVPGHSSRGTVKIPRGGVNWPKDLKRLKLFRDHSDVGGKPVGYATNLVETAAGIEATFTVGNTPDGDAALADVTEGIRDALSVEIMGGSLGPGGAFTNGTITAVALVAVPAFEEARVAAFTASLHEVEGAETDTRPADESDGDDAENSSDVGPAGNNNDDETTPNPEGTEMDNPKLPAMAPIGLATASAAAPAITFSQVVDTLVATRENRPSNELTTAALADITRSAHPSIRSADWLGELWEGVSFQREIVPTMTKKELTSLRATGWRWTTKPSVSDYEGDKTEIPTNTPATESVELVAKRLAGGHDIDRAYFDFNDREFIASYFRAMTESYAMVSDQRAAEFLVAEAAKNQAPAQTDLLRAAARARQTIKAATRAEATSFLVNPDDLFSLMDMTILDNPAYLDLLGVDPKRFITSNEVEAGTLVAYAKPAVEFRELGSAPIRVEAEHLAQGGRDAALFGYYATFVANPAGIVQVPFTAPSGE